MEPRQHRRIVSDRRRSSRLIPPGQVAGTLRVTQDVIIERVAEEELTMVSHTPMARHEEVVLQVQLANGDATIVAARAVARQPVIVNGKVRHRSRMQVIDIRGTAK